MSSMSDYLETKLIDHILRGTSYSLPSGTFIALFTASPTDAGTGAEVQTANWPSYARIDAKLTGLQSSAWTATGGGNDGLSRNANILTWSPNDGSAAVTVTHVGIYDAVTGGNLLFHGALAASKTLEVGDVISFAANAISITLA